MKTETIIFDTPAPHPGPIQIGDLLTDIEAVIKRHVILSDHAAAALAVWVLHTYTFEQRDTVAYVAIESPEKRCGKTTLLSVLAAMACKSLITSNITVGALFRAIHTCMPTLFIDEADTFLAGNNIMRGIINSGNTRRTAYVLRLSASKRNHVGRASCPPVDQASRLSSELSQPSTFNQQPSAPVGRACVRAVPDSQLSTINSQLSSSSQPSTIHSQLSSNHDSGLKKYSCWCPKVIAMIGEVPDTIADRSIVVKMARKLTTETCAPLALLDTAEIRAKCARFALDSRDTITRAPKIRSENLNDRAADTFDPLLVIARMAGPDWEQKLRTAALALSPVNDAEHSHSGLILDIIDLFVLTGSEKMFTRDIITRLRDGGLKSHTLKSSHINEYQISKILRHYGVRPLNLRIGKEVHRGYLADDFREAMTRYVSEDDIRARVTGIRQQWQLQEEAHAEARAETAEFEALEAKLKEKLKEAAAEDKTLDRFEIEDLVEKLKNEHETADTTSSSPAEPNNVGDDVRRL